MDWGLVIIVTGIYKGYSRLEREKVIYWFLLREANVGVAPDTFPATLWGLRESTNPFEDDAGRGGAEKNDGEASDVEANTGCVRPIGPAREDQHIAIALRQQYFWTGV
ncbi:hypothetical protein LZ30DRAFT_784813 [Colletotrichum cereale]|nr:hypothetical protein LZ30DRAFT_784813 [Colletotrichum cereale]